VECDVIAKNLAVEACGVVSWSVRKVGTASGAAAVQVVTRRGRQLEHVGPAHNDAELALLLTAARERLSAQHNRRCSWRLKPPVSRSDLAM
jgi:hypothetical protein